MRKLRYKGSIAQVRYRGSTAMQKDLGIAEAAHEVAADDGPQCSEGKLRRLERMGVVRPARDPWGRRLFGRDDVLAARAYLTQQQRAAAA